MLTPLILSTYLIASQLIHFHYLLTEYKLQQLIAKTTQVLQEPRGGLENKNGVSVLSFKIYLFLLKKAVCRFPESPGTSLVIQWLRLHAPSGGGLGLIPCQGTRAHLLQERVCWAQLKIPCAATKT